ncbi:protease modulator HflC [Candidatus Sumerlaeota bacterium]|nr:protease modulator HflC [Candidatus Sumerlaeota bacterium]
MKSTYISLPLIAIGVILIAVVSSALFIVTETQQVVITEFGKPIKEIREPGLYVKKPFIQKLHYFDDRLLEWDGYPTQIPTKDKKYIWVDTFARWRIVEPLTFLQSVYNETGAQARLDDIVDSAVRNQISRYILLEAVRNSNRPMATEIIEEGEKLGTVEIENIAMGRDEITKLILKEAQELADQYGIQLVDVRIKRINYVETVRKKVYSRMIAERKRIAELYRSEGQATRMEILGKKEWELKKIHSEAFKEAEQIRGVADAEAVRIYAEAYNKDPEFYSFLKTMETYKATLGEKSWLILTTKGDFFRYLPNFIPEQEE